LLLLLFYPFVVPADLSQQAKLAAADSLNIQTQYGTHHSYVLVVHTLRVAENEILKLDLPAKRH
jgi:hypothetical protein